VILHHVYRKLVSLSLHLSLYLVTVHHSLTGSLFKDLDTVKSAVVVGLITLCSWKKQTLAYCLNPR